MNLWNGFDFYYCFIKKESIPFSNYMVSYLIRVDACGLRLG